MKWSKNPPTEPGFYWWRLHDCSVAYYDQMLVEVYKPGPKGADDVLWADDPNGCRTLQEFGGEWWPERIEPPHE